MPLVSIRENIDCLYHTEQSHILICIFAGWRIQNAGSLGIGLKWYGSQIYRVSSEQLDAVKFDGVIFFVKVIKSHSLNCMYTM